MQKLPHLVKTKTGIYRYRRRVPDDLRGEIGKTEIVVSLRTTDPKKLAINYSRIHGETERLFAEAKSKLGISDDIVFEEALKKLKAYGFDNLQDRRDKSDAEDIILRDAGFFASDDLSEALAEYPDGKEPLPLKVTSTALGILAGTTTGPRPTLSYCLKLFLEDKARGRDKTKKDWVNYERERKRITSELITTIGDKEIPQITRLDARSFVKVLEANGYRPASLRKQTAFLKAMISHAQRELELQGNNPFANISIAAPIDEDEEGVSFTYEEVVILLSKTNSINDELQEIVRLLACTGARLSEISGLQLQDVDCKQGILNLRFNSIRRLKNKQSIRLVPVVDNQALKALCDRIKRSDNKEGTAPVFPRYGKNGGADSASAALSKWLTKIGLRNPDDKKPKTTHSLRHTFKDALRETSIHRDVANMLQGHTAGDASSGYGSNELIEAKREAARKVWSLYGMPL